MKEEKKKSSSGLILKIYNQRRTLNSKYSLNAYARDLGVSKASLVQILNGKRTLTLKMLSKIIQKLPDSNEKNKLVAFEKKMQTPLRIETFNEQEKSLFGDWRYFVILLAVEILDKTATVENLHALTSISKVQLKKLLPQLEDLKQISIKDKVVKRIKTSMIQSNVPKELILKHHLESLKLSKNAIVTEPENLIKFHSLTIAIEESRLEKINELTTNYIKKVLKELKSHNVDRVYKLNTQFFPISKKNGSK